MTDNGTQREAPPTAEGVQARLQQAINELFESGEFTAHGNPGVRDRLQQIIAQAERALPQGYTLTVFTSATGAPWRPPEVRVFCATCRTLPCRCADEMLPGYTRGDIKTIEQHMMDVLTEGTTHEIVEEFAPIDESTTVADIETQIEQAVTVLKEGGDLKNDQQSVEKIADVVGSILRPHQGRFRATLQPSAENSQDLEVLIQERCKACRTYECVCGRDDLTQEEQESVNLDRLQQLIELEHENTSLREQVIALQSKIETRYEPRTRVPVLDAIIGKKFSVLKDGHIQLIDYMGDDSSIVQAARVSYGEGTKTVRADEALIRYLMRMKHMSPFEMCSLKLKIRLPMDVMRQLVRHRTGKINEYSTRYSVAIDSAETASSKEWRLQAKDNKQGSSGVVDREVGIFLSHREQELHKNIRKVYQERLEAGVAREQARKDLPLSTYTEIFWKMDLRNLLHFLGLRLDPHAQLEIRSYAEAIAREIMPLWVPWTWQAYQDYHVDSLTLSGPEVTLMGNLARVAREKEDPEAARAFGLSYAAAGHARGLSKRELREFAAKYERLTGEKLTV